MKPIHKYHDPYFKHVKGGGKPIDFFRKHNIRSICCREQIANPAILPMGKNEYDLSLIDKTINTSTPSIPGKTTPSVSREITVNMPVSFKGTRRTGAPKAISYDPKNNLSTRKKVVRLEEPKKGDGRKEIGGGRILYDGENIMPGEYKYIKMVDVGGPPGSEYNVPVIAGYTSASGRTRARTYRR